MLRDLVAQHKDRLYSDFVWRFTLPSQGKLPYHRFKRGDSVMLAPLSQDDEDNGDEGSGSGSWQDSSGSEADAGDATMADGSDSEQQQRGLEGTVLEVGRNEVQIAVAMQGGHALEEAGPDMLWRIDQGVSDTTSKRQLAALDRLGEMLNDASPGERAVREVLLGLPQAEARAATPSAWATNAQWMAAAVKQLEAQKGALNHSQLRAVAIAITRTYTLWQGPPGTGKTRTLMAFIEVMVRSVAASRQQQQAQGAVLAVADTNAAADNLLEGLLSRGIKAVRVGQPAKVRPELRHACLDALVEQSEEGKRAVDLRARGDTCMRRKLECQQQLRALQAQQQQGHQNLGQPAQEPAHLAHLVSRLSKEAANAYEQADRLVSGASVSTLKLAPVIVTTCNGAGERRLQRQSFRVVVMDEASQATEPASLVPLLKGAECVVMAGDQRQLPPTVISQRAVEECQLDVPLFSRLIDGGVRTLLLDEQYRMHPAIAAFPSQQFYGGLVRSGITEQHRPPIQGIPWPNPSCPVHFVNVDGFEERSSSRSGQRGPGKSSSERSGASGGASFSNFEEAEIAMRVMAFMARDPSVESIALLSPYSGQVRLLNSQLSKLDLSQYCPITVSTVDGYQGREADGVIFSTVRCNDEGQLGFLKDERRLNVAITRARRGLVVIGNAATLKNDPNWRAWLAWVWAQRGQQAQRPSAPK
ncbi:hypothetical protein D9Q98_009377 [Chlorella vulgaris]|uniref:Uncharacterized protein n=1 Tax=Chlorella vulgaris TaxID=3077 RepID=A0A9D4TPB9_CHLVU|nr:hypothetical protein D9Q98_009377 [Chlorella vulgaris]